MTCATIATKKQKKTKSFSVLFTAFLLTNIVGGCGVCICCQGAYQRHIEAMKARIKAEHDFLMQHKQETDALLEEDDFTMVSGCGWEKLEC